MIPSKQTEDSYLSGTLFSIDGVHDLKPKRKKKIIYELIGTHATIQKMVPISSKHKSGLIVYFNRDTIRCISFSTEKNLYSLWIRFYNKIILNIYIFHANRLYIKIKFILNFEVTVFAILSTSGCMIIKSRRGLLMLKTENIVQLNI